MHYARLAVPALAAFACACSANRSAAIINPAMASSVPADTVLLAGVDLERLRSTPLYQSQMPELMAGFPSLRDTSYLLIAYNAHDVMFLGHGKYAEAPAGATRISGDLMVSGTPESVRAAIAQHQAGVTGSPQLVELARSIAGGHQLWMVAKGGVTLPLTGNASNLNRVLHLTQYVTLSVQIDSRIQVVAAAVGRNADASRQLEESVRALVTLAAAESGRQPAIATALKSVDIRRDDLTVQATLATDTGSTESLIRELMR